MYITVGICLGCLWRIGTYNVSNSGQIGDGDEVLEWSFRPLLIVLASHTNNFDMVVDNQGVYHKGWEGRNGET